jgi:hypothetical protein
MPLVTAPLSGLEKKISGHQLRTAFHLCSAEQLYNRRERRVKLDESFDKKIILSIL